MNAHHRTVPQAICPHARALTVGVDAARAVRGGGQAHVVAVFAGSLYLRAGADWACLGGPDIGNAPLNIPCVTGGFADWRDVAAVGMPATRGADALCLGALSIDLAAADLWRNADAICPDGQGIAAGLDLLYAALPAKLPDGGLAAFIRPSPRLSGPVERVAKPSIDALVRWLRADPASHSAACPRGAVAALLGLGPGLTPSGDDFLAGFARALRCTGYTDTARALAAGIEALAAARTSELSAAHLCAALRSGLSERLERLIGAVLRAHPAAIAAEISALQRAQHHSSWDVLAGTATALRTSSAHTGP